MKGQSPKRVIVRIEFGGTLGTVAEDSVSYLRQQGRRPRTYRRHVRAENKTIPVLVIVADEHVKEGDPS